MALIDRTTLDRMIRQGQEFPVWLLSSPDGFLLDTYASRIIGSIREKGETDVTVIEGPVPEIGQAVQAAGEISLFGTRRIVHLRHIAPTQIAAEDLALLCELAGEAESAVLLITVQTADDPYEKKRRKTSGKDLSLNLPACAKELAKAAQDRGCACFLEKPNEASAALFAGQRAKSLGASFAPGAAEYLVGLVGLDLFTLQSETDKLAAGSGYGEISRKLIDSLCTRSLDAVSFDMVRALIGKRSKTAFDMLVDLLRMQNEPVQIAGALNSSFIDMVRVRTAREAGISVEEAYRTFVGGKSAYRFEKSLEASAPYSMNQLAEFIGILDRLDRKLKGSAVEGEVLLQLALGEILAAARRS